MDLITEPGTIAVIGPIPPPRGGVSESVARFCAALRSDGREVRHVGPKDLPAQLRLILTSVHQVNHALVANVSTARGLFAATSVAMATRASRRVAFIHGSILSREFRDGSMRRQRLIRVSLGRFDEVWVNNEAEYSLFTSALSGPDLVIVSPFCRSHLDISEPAKVSERPFDLLCAERTSDPSVYGLDLVVDAWDQLRSTRPALMMAALLYGGTPEVTSARRASLEARGVRVFADLDPGDVRELLEQTVVLVRPTRRDGDSLMVREALVCGCRVLASGVAPRPLGCEVVDPTVASIVDGVARGGTPANGSGLGIDPVEALFGRPPRT